MKIVDYLMIGATIRIGREILCLPYAGFFQNIMPLFKMLLFGNGLPQLTYFSNKHCVEGEIVASSVPGCHQGRKQLTAGRLCLCCEG